MKGATGRHRWYPPRGYSASDLPVRAAAGENGRLVVEADEPTELLHRLTGWAS